MVSSSIVKPGNSSGYMGNGGSGKFVPMRRKSGQKPDDLFANTGQGMMNFEGNDPVYMIFKHLDSQPVSKLADDFIKENIKYPLIQFMIKMQSRRK